MPGALLFSLFFLINNSPVTETTYELRTGCPSDLFVRPGKDLIPEAGYEGVFFRTGVARCMHCAKGDVLFYAPPGTCTRTYQGTAYTLTAETRTQGQDIYATYTGNAPAEVFTECLGTIVFQRTPDTVTDSYRVRFQLRAPQGRHTSRVQALVTLIDENCEEQPNEFPPPVTEVIQLPSVSAAVPCPVDLHTLDQLTFELGFDWNVSATNTITSANVTVPPGCNAFLELGIQNTTFDGQLPTSVVWTNYHNSSLPSDNYLCSVTRAGLTVDLLADVTPTEIDLFGPAPAYVFEACLASITAVLNPFVAHPQPPPYCISYSVFVGVNVTNVNGTDVFTPLFLNFTTCLNVTLPPCYPFSPLIPKIVDAGLAIPFGFGCLRQGHFHLGQLIRTNAAGASDLLSQLDFECEHCLQDGLKPVIEADAHLPAGVQFLQLTEDSAVCVARPGATGILITRYLDWASGDWRVALRPLGIPAPTVADYIACAQGVTVEFGAGAPTHAGVHEIKVTAFVGALINPFVICFQATVTFSAINCDTCLRELHPYDLRGFHGLKPLRTYPFAPAPYPVPSAQAPTPFIAAVPLLEWEAHLNPPCPLCGFRISFAPGTNVWQQDFLVCPANLPSYVWCNYDQQTKTLTLNINPTSWTVSTPGLIEWLLARVRYVNSAALHVQGIRAFTLAFLQCGVEQPLGWHNNQTFASVELVTTDIPGAPQCPYLRAGGTEQTVAVSMGPVNVEPLLLLEDGLYEKQSNYEPWQGVVGASVVVTNCHPDEDILDVDPSTAARFSGLGIRWNQNGCKLTLEGSRPFPDYATLLRNVRYFNTRGEHATEGVRIIHIFVWTPRCASRYWVSRLHVVADCNGRCTCTPRFGVNWTPSAFLPGIDPWSELYYGRAGVFPTIVETQAPLIPHPGGRALAKEDRSLWNLYCAHPSPPGGHVTRVDVCISHGYDDTTDQIVWVGQTEAAWRRFMDFPHVSAFQPPTIVAARRGAYETSDSCPWPYENWFVAPRRLKKHHHFMTREEERRADRDGDFDWRFGMHGGNGDENDGRRCIGLGPNCRHPNAVPLLDRHNVYVENDGLFSQGLWQESFPHGEWAGAGNQLGDGMTYGPGYWWNDDNWRNGAHDHGYGFCRRKQLCITLKPSAPTTSLPSSAFLEEINSHLVFVLGGGNNCTRRRVQDREITVTFHTDASQGSGVCTPPPVKVLLHLVRGQVRIFRFGGTGALPWQLPAPVPVPQCPHCPPSPPLPPLPNGSVLVLGVVTDLGVECPAIRNLFGQHELYTLALPSNTSVCRVPSAPLLTQTWWHHLQHPELPFCPQLPHIPTVPCTTVVPPVGTVVLVWGIPTPFSTCQQGITLSVLTVTPLPDLIAPVLDSASMDLDGGDGPGAMVDLAGMAGSVW